MRLLRSSWQSVTRAAAAIRRAERAIEVYGNGSDPAEEAYTEAAAALNELMEADAALHPPTGASSSSSAPRRIARGAANLGLETYRAFVKGKGKGGSKTDEDLDRDGHQEQEDESEQEEGPDPEDEDYEEEVEEEHEVDEGEESLVEVELEVIQEEEEEQLQEDGQGPISEPEADVEDRPEEEAPSGARDPSAHVTEEEFVLEEHDSG